MEKDKHITEVMFRKDKSGEFKGEITAVFPYINNAGHLEMLKCLHIRGLFQYMRILHTPRQNLE
jgi:hypothetical protein